MSKITDIMKAADKYRTAVSNRRASEETVSVLGARLRDEESDLRSLKEIERRALIDFQDATEQSA